MLVFEYRVVPAPRKGKSAKGLRGTPAKFANAVSDMMNDLGAEGWEYVRADTLPCEERQGLTGKTVKYHSMLVFRRPAQEEQETAEDETLALPVPVEEPEVLVSEPVDDVEDSADEPMVNDMPETAEPEENPNCVAAE